MHYLNISFTHKNSTIEIREKLSYPNEKNLHGCLKKLTASDVINEAMLISTCNRMEVFCSCSDVTQAIKYIFEILSNRAGISIEELKARADIFDDSTAIHHLFSVASSLDSMVIGETQIAGQLKDAFRFSYDNGYSAKKIARAIKSAFACASKVRNATDISSKPVSMASVAVAKLKSVTTETLAGKKALVIGVGEMSEISAKHLISAGVEVHIMNRTKHKAEILANVCGAKVLEFEKLCDAINEFDILFTATSSHEPIITDAMIKNCDFERYWFDLALPRDIQHKLGGNIHLYVIDDLKVIVDENMSLREDAAKLAHGIIGRAVVDYFEWLNTLDIEPMIKEIYLKAFAAAQEESQRAVHHGFIPKKYEKEAQKMCEQALKRFLHEMTQKMRSSSRESNAETMSNAFGFLAQQ
jgi:glutamyl-tRNA reductase